MALCLKKANVNTLIKKYIIAKKCQPPEPSSSHNLFAGGESCLDVDAADWSEWWLQKAGVAVTIS